MSYNNEKALETIRLFHDKTMKKSRLVVKDALKNLAGEMVDRTPTFFEDLPESGNTKANWRFSLDSPDTTYQENIADLGGEATKADINGSIQSSSVKDSSVLYVTNSSPSMRYLEYGLYPNPPRIGSIHPVTGVIEQRSEGGFSKQAPSGIVYVSALKWPEFVADAQAKYAGPAS